MYLLDTNVVSELRKPKPHGGVTAWIQQSSEAELHLSAVTIGDIQSGIEIMRAQDSAKAAERTQWLDQLTDAYNVLPMDGIVFREWARLMHRASETLYEDAMIAATARVHGLVVVTRNVADFRPFKVQVLNPFARK